MSESLLERLAQQAVRYVTEPPSGPSDVIEFEPPESLLAAFGSTAAIPFGRDAAAVDDEALLGAVDLVLKHSVHTSHPRFLNQNFAGPDPVAVIGDWLGAALNTTGATFEAAPVFTLMESAVLTKLANIAGYVGDPLGDAAGSISADDDPDNRVLTLPPGLFCPGGSTATLYALQLARHRRQPDIVRRGASGDRLTVFVSDAGHYAATKSAALLGLGSDAVIKVDADSGGAIIPAALELAIEASRLAGEVPLAVIGTAGTTVTSAFDDLKALADICERQELWLHVDGCYGGSALFSPTHRHLLAGVERSDSFVWNLHKMMGMTQQCTALLVRDPTQLAPCFAGQADYLFQPDKQNADLDSGDRTFQCARRIDVLKLWLAWKHHGDAGFTARVDHAYRMAEHCRAVIAGSGDVFTPIVSGDFTNVVFAWVPPDLRPLRLESMPGRSPGGGEVDRNGNRNAVAALSPEVRDLLHAIPPKIKARMQSEGTAMVGFQPMFGLNTFRMLFMSPTVTERDVEEILARIDEYGTDATTELGLERAQP